MALGVVLPKSVPKTSHRGGARASHQTQTNDLCSAFGATYVPAEPARSAGPTRLSVCTLTRLKGASRHHRVSHANCCGLRWVCGLMMTLMSVGMVSPAASRNACVSSAGVVT